MKKLILPIFVVCCSIVEAPLSAQDKTPDLKTRGIDVSLLDSGVSPKKDFYQYVNGKWIEKAQIPAGRSSWGSFDEINERNSQNLLIALDKAHKEEKYPAGTDQHKALSFYQLAMDTTYINYQGYNPLKPYLNEIRAVRDRESLQVYLEKASQQGVRGFFDFEVYPDFKESSINKLYLLPGDQGLPNKEYYTKEDEKSAALRGKYKVHISKMFELTGYTPAEAKLKAGNVLELETRLAVPMLSEAEKRNPMLLYNKRSVAELAELTPHINWKSYFDVLGINGVDSVIIFEPKYMEVVEQVLAEKKIASVRDYLEWHAIHHAAAYLSKDFTELDHEFYGKVLWGAEEQKPRREAVLEVSNKFFGEAIGRIYVDEYFKPEARERAFDMVNKIVAAFEQRIETLDWMTDQTKKQALKKLETLNIKVGYPDKWKDYSEVAVKSRKDSGSYLENVMTVSRWKFKQSIDKINQRTDKAEWFMAPQTVNAYYSPVLNEIAVTAGMLQPPFFYAQADEAVNYGAIGVVIGHEISHGFDDIGSRFDADGNMKNWWAPEDQKVFEAKKQLLTDQYNAYKPLPGVKINGAMTLGENMGDLSGISVAYDALIRNLKEEGRPGNIEGLSQEQRFFISYVTIWRVKQKEEALRNALMNDPHCPAKFRAIGSLENLDSFHSAFQIEKGDPMFKPKGERIKIW